MDNFPMLEYAKLLREKPYKIPIDHKYEDAVGIFPVVPVIGFIRNNSLWEAQTVLCIDDGGYGVDAVRYFRCDLNSAYRDTNKRSIVTKLLENEDDWYVMPSLLYDELKRHLQYVKMNELYTFKYIFQVIGNTILSAMLVIDEDQESVNTFEEMRKFETHRFIISPKVDNSKTMKNQLQFMAQCLKARIEFQEQPFDEPSSDMEMAITRDEDEYKRIEKKPKRQWKFTKNRTDKLIVKGQLSVEIYKFIKEQGYEFQDN